MNAHHKTRPRGNKRAAERLVFCSGEPGMLFHAGALTLLSPVGESVGVPALHHYRATLNPGELLEPSFFKKYTSQGLTALSLIDDVSDDVIYLDGRKKALDLYLSKGTYFALGITGKIIDRTPERYTIRIDLDAPGFSAGHQGYDHIRKCLTAWPVNTAPSLPLFDMFEQPAPANPEFTFVFTSDVALPFELLAAKVMHDSEFTAALDLSRLVSGNTPNRELLGRIANQLPLEDDDDNEDKSTINRNIQPIQFRKTSCIGFFSADTIQSIIKSLSSSSFALIQIQAPTHLCSLRKDVVVLNGSIFVLSYDQ